MKRMIVGLVLAAALSLPAMAQGVSEANGTVTDRDGNPIQGAVVTIRPKSNPDSVYTAKTSKKGRFFVSGLFTPIESEKWQIECNADGYTAVAVRIESRTVNKVLITEPWTAKLKPNSSPTEIAIRPLGAAKLDWKVARTEDVEAELRVQQEAAAAAAGTGEGTQAAPKKDPWVEALTLASAGSLEESVEFFGEAVEDEPDNAERHETFAKILYRLERHDEAEVEAARAVEIDPGRVESQLVLFNVSDKRGDMETARTILEQAQAATPQDSRIVMRLAYVARETGDGEGAIAAYQRATEINPENAEAWLELANLHSAAGNLGESENAYAKVVAINPEGAHQTYYNLGATIIKRGNASVADTGRAIEAFRKALEIRPDYGRAAQELAIALITTGDRVGARDTLQTFVKANPNSPETPRMKALIQSLQ